MIWLIGILAFLLVVGSTWWMGLWNNLINLTIFFVASLTASSFYENMANMIVQQDSSWIAMAEFISVWLIFFLTFVLMRAVTDMVSKYRLKFDKVTELVGRSVLAIWLASAFVCFTFFTLHLAPLPPHLFKSDPTREMPKPGEIPSFVGRTSPADVGFGPDRLWLAFIQSRSRGALSEYRNTSMFPTMPGTPHPDDPPNARVFDPGANFFDARYWRRRSVSKNTNLRVVRPAGR